MSKKTGHPIRHNTDGTMTVYGRRRAQQGRDRGVVGLARVPAGVTEESVRAIISPIAVTAPTKAIRFAAIRAALVEHLGADPVGPQNFQEAI